MVTSQILNFADGRGGRERKERKDRKGMAEGR